MARLTRRQVWIIIAALGVVGVVTWGFLPKPVTTGVAIASRGPLEVVVEEEGKTRVVDRYIISAPAAGYCRRISVNAGDSVSSGQVLAEIQPLPDLISSRQRDIVRAQLEAAQARLAQAKEALGIAQEEAAISTTEFNRIEALFASDNSTAQQLDHARLAHRRARAQATSAEFSVRVAEYDIKATQSALRAYSGGGAEASVRLTAPVDGSLLKIYQKSEGPVQAGTPLIEIGNPASLEVQVDVLSTDAVKIRPGMKVRLKRWGTGAVLDAAVRVVEPSGFTRVSALGVEEQRVPVIVDIRSPDSEWRVLGDGFRIVAEFLIWEADDVLQIPSSALFRSDDEWRVFVVDGRVAKERTVEIGNESGLYAEVLGGLAEGATVISHPDERIASGTRISPRRQ